MSPWRSWESVWPRLAAPVAPAGGAVATGVPDEVALGTREVDEVDEVDEVAVPAGLAVLWATLLVVDPAIEVEGAWGIGVARTVRVEERRTAKVVSCMAA